GPAGVSAVVLGRVRLVAAHGTAAHPTDVLLVNGRIAAIGADLDAAGARRIDLDGRYLMPGMWDQHVHFGQWAAVSRRLDLSAARSAAEAADLVRARISDGHPRGDVLLGF